MIIPSGPPREVRVAGGVYILLALTLWPFPLLGLLHVESSAAVAGVAFFTAGLLAVDAFRRGRPAGRVLTGQVAALVAPWLLLTATLLWRPNCGYFQGFLFFLLFAPGSVVLGVALAYALTGFLRRGARAAFTAVGLAVAVLTPLYDLGLHPQFYTYNHVFGGVLGPIYDEELAVRPGLFYFRALSLLWGLFLFLGGAWMRRRRRGIAGAAVACGVGIALAYGFAAPLGINTPAWYAQERLGGALRTEHFDIYYDPGSFTPEELAYLADEHEYHFDRLRGILGTAPEERIGSYLYPDPETKAALTGARYTNVAPVWLPDPQVHVLAPAFAEVFPHELAHVFSRAFGLPVLNASLSVGLVEGLAVALEPPQGRPSPHDQVAAAALARAGPLAGTGRTLADGVAARLTPLGFWTDRGAVSYTTMGSFVAFLMERYGPARLRAVYAHGDFEDVYGRSPEALAAEWEAYVMGRPVTSRAAGELALRRFRVPSLFEKPCPHHVPPYRRRVAEAAEAVAVGDTARALVLLERSLAEQPHYAPALDAWARLRLGRGEADAVLERLAPAGVDTLSAALAVRAGDAYVLAGLPGRAAERYETAYGRLPLYAHDEQALVLLRGALRGEPEVLHTWLGDLPPEEQAERLAAFADRSGAVVWLRALRLAEAGAFERAAALLRQAPSVGADTPARRALLERQRLAWIARFLLRAGRAQPARTGALRAARAFREAGDLDAAARLAALAERARWIEARPRSL